MKKITLIIAFVIFTSCTHTTPRDIAGEFHGINYDAKAWDNISSADLKKKYKNIWVISDVHGQFKKLTSILSAKTVGLINKDGDWYKWNPKATGQLLIVLGDLIHKGPDSIGVVRLVSELQDQAKNHNSRVLIFLGNNELEYLFEPTKLEQEVNDSADMQIHRKWLGGKISGEGINATELMTTQFYKEIAKFKLGGIIGSWLFVHAGYIDSKKNQAAVESYIEVIQTEYIDKNYEFLVDPVNDGSSIITRHNWFRDPDKITKTYEILNIMGLTGVVFGHDPDAFDDLYKEKGKTSIGTLAAGPEERSLKIDAGISNEYNKPPRILKCPMTQIWNSSGEMVLVEKKVKRCVQVTPSSEQAIPTL